MRCYNTRISLCSFSHFSSKLIKRIKERSRKLKISEIQIVPIKPQDGLVAFVSFVLDNSLYLGSIGIITRPEGGYRLVYPTKKVGSRNINIYHPINRSFAETIEKEVIGKFEDVMKNHDRYDSADT